MSKIDTDILLKEFDKHLEWYQNQENLARRNQRDLEASRMRDYKLMAEYMINCFKKAIIDE
jgi:ParB-like chromosome segregation protein Spo0J